MINCVMSNDHIHIDSLIIDGLIERKEYIKMDNIYQHACKTCLWLMIVTTALPSTDPLQTRFQPSVGIETRRSFLEWFPTKTSKHWNAWQ